MNIRILYSIVALVLLASELVYFKIADKCNIIDKPNERERRIRPSCCEAVA